MKAKRKDLTGLLGTHQEANTAEDYMFVYGYMNRAGIVLARSRNAKVIKKNI